MDAFPVVTKYARRSLRSRMGYIESGDIAMKRIWHSRSVLFAALALAACLALLLSHPAIGFGGAPGTQSSTVKAADSVPAGQRVFYAAHSLMWPIPDPLNEVVNAYGIKDHVMVGLQSLGFSQTIAHWNLGEAQNQAKKALKTGKVDAFVMSPMDMPDPGVDNFVALGLENNPKTRFYLQNNWAGFNNDGQKARRMMMGPPWDSSTEEQLKTLNTECEKAFEAQAKQINEKNGHPVIFIIPTSQANHTLRAMIVRKEFPGLDKQSQLFADQIGHPTAALVTLNTYLHFATIYGRSPVGLPMPKILKQANNAKWDENFNKALQELAWKTVIEYPYSGVKAPADKK
jgi:hypothetical protein